MVSDAGGRATPGRLSFALGLPLAWRAALLPSALAGLVLLTRLPLRTRYLLNWDADQFALGIDHFDVIHHQPHPPGYLVYVALGRLLEPLLGNANAALVTISIAGECAGVVIAYLFARKLFGAWAGLVAGLALALSPLFWYYGEAANTYALEPALALGVAWAAWRCWNGRAAAALPAGITLALAGAFRPSTAVLLSPLVLAALWKLGSRRALLAAAAGSGLLTAAWVVPLLVLAGGPGRYLQAALQLGGSVTTGTAVWRAGLAGLETTSGAVLLGLVWDLGAFAVIALFGLGVAPRLGRVLDLPAGWARFCLVWTAPALLTFLLVHIGQVVYVQLFTPALFLMAGPAALAACRVLGRPRLAGSIVGVALAVNCLTFLLPLHYSLASQLSLHDQVVAQTVALVSAEDPASTVLITDVYAIGSYRTAQVYLPAYHRVALARDLKGRPGEIFGDVYEPGRLDRASPLAFPAVARTFLFLDRQVVDGLVADPERLTSAKLADGTRIYTWKGPAPVLRHGQVWLGPDYRDTQGRNI